MNTHAHGGLTERSRSYHGVTHDRKGREGNRKGSGGESRCGDFSSCRPVGDARTSRLAMMSEACEGCAGKGFVAGPRVCDQCGGLGYVDPDTADLMTHFATPSGTGVAGEVDPTPTGERGNDLGEPVSGLPQGSDPSQRGGEVS